MTAKIYTAMAAVMKATGAIGKDQKNVQQNFKYRGIDDVYNALHTILADNGVFMTPEVLDRWRDERTNKNGTVLAYTVLRMKYTFYADDGSSVSCIVEGEGMDSGDKSSNKAMAVAHKYALLQCFCIPTAETKDPDAESHEVVAAPAQTPELTDSQRKQLIADLEIICKRGSAALKDAWESLEAEGRKAVGGAKLDQLKKLAAKNDKEVA